MRRVVAQPRTELASIATEAGFHFATDAEGNAYWDETAYYSFNLEQIERDLEEPTNELAALCVELVGRAVRDDALFTRLRLPLELQDLARASWERGDPTLYGRFDFSYDARGPAKLLEYNADTPTGLFEAAVFQWNWLEDLIESGDLPAGSDQFNSIHDALIAHWPHMAAGDLHLAALEDEEDGTTVRYLAETAVLAGLQTTILTVPEIGDDRRRRHFVDLDNRPIGTLFKLYPWEWLIADPFGASPSMGATRFVEPAWKAILSTKAALPLLWEMEPKHPNLLPARFADDPTGTDIGLSYARKLLRSREGANVELVQDGQTIERTEGSYFGPAIEQALAPLPNFDGNRPVIGSWVVGDRSCGIGIRESRSAITTNTSRFVPHIIRES